MLGSITYIVTLLALALNLMALVRLAGVDQALATMVVASAAAIIALVITKMSTIGARWPKSLSLAMLLIATLHLASLPLPLPGFIVWASNAGFALLSYRLHQKLFDDWQIHRSANSPVK